MPDEANARTDPGHFSTRLLTDRKLKIHVHVERGPKPRDDRYVMAVPDQLLACRSVPFDVEAEVRRLGGRATFVTTLLTGLDPPPDNVEDVDIFRIDLPRHDTVVDVVRKLRGGLEKPSEKAKISPNHILVPAAADDHSCPYGPPSDAPPGPSLDPAVGDTHRVTIIDSGYQWNHGEWGANPLERPDPLGQPRWFSAVKAERIGLGGWEPDLADVLSVHEPDVLDALAGHANFIAGVIIQRCPDVEITILNHNGGFDPNADNFPTEAAVARSLCMSKNAEVIDLGFAFRTLDDISSCAWDVAIAYIGSGTAGSGPLVVAPAGNQRSRDPRYPAALQGKYPNVIGVASLSKAPADGAFVKSIFSNHGPWVTCSALGSKVRSTFLPVYLKVQDDPDPRQPHDFTNGWAQWNGTSFATPRVVAAIASHLEPGTTALGTWLALKGRGTPDPNGRLGVQFRDLDLI